LIESVSSLFSYHPININFVDYTTEINIKNIKNYGKKMSFQIVYKKKFSTDKERSLEMSAILDEVLKANKDYSEHFDKGTLAIPPARHFAILTCMDARLDPAKFAGLIEGDAHIIRNAGGRASDDAIRSLIISHKLLGTKEWFVIHHTDCGMQLFTNEVMYKLLSESLDTAVFDGKHWQNPTKDNGSNEGQYINWLTFENLEQSVIDDVHRIRNHPLVPKTIPIYGFIYDVRSGKLVEVPKAMAIGTSKT